MTSRLCTSNNCERPVQSRGMCTTHYSNWYRENSKRTRECAWCGESFTTARTDTKFCGMSCGGKYANSIARTSEGWAAYQIQVQADKKPAPIPVPVEIIRANHLAARSELRASYEEGRWDDFIAELYLRSMITDGCWVWQGTQKTPTKSLSPYPVVKWRKQSRQVHRMSLEARLRAPLGTQQSHHVCANTLCVNPWHLQPATQVQNIAEMKARCSYEARIAELEEALSEMAPDHELLNRIRYGA